MRELPVVFVSVVFLILFIVFDLCPALPLVVAQIRGHKDIL